MTDYATAKIQRDKLEALVRDKTAALKAISGVGKGKMGLTPDSVKASPEYKKAKSEFTSAFNRLRNFNEWIVKTYAAEMRAERKMRRPS